MLTIEDFQKDSISKFTIYGAAVTFSCVVGFSFLAIKICMEVASTLQILTYRYNFAVLGASLPLLFKWVKIDLTGKSIRKLIRPAALYIGFMASQTAGLLFATTIESGIIYAIVPILAKIMAYFYLGEKGNWKQNLYVTLSISAVIAMFVFSITDFEGLNMKGLLLLTSSSILMAFSNIFTRGIRKEFNPYAIAFTICLIGCLVFNLSTCAIGIASGGPIEYFNPIGHWRFIIAIIFLAIPSTLGSSLLMAFMLANMEAVKATIFGNLSTGISVVAGVIFLNEPLRLYHIICTLLIITGVIGTSVTGNKTNES